MPTVREVMTKDPITLPSSAKIVEAARAMRDADVGNIIVYDNDEVTGIITDRDIVVRIIAEGQDPNGATVGDAATRGVKTLSPDDQAGEAIKLMRQGAIRRIPIVENNRPVGIVALGDVAAEFDPNSALGQISEAPGNE